MKKAKHLAALPLGGVGIIGTNMMVYDCDGDLIVVDAGVSFPNENTPGVDVIVPDTRFLRDHAKNIKAVFITHGHEDHIGAVGYLWDDFAGAPVYGSPIANLIAQSKLQELGIKPQKGQLRVAKAGEPVKLGKFSVEYVPVSHSVLESFALAITTPYGTIVHTGDYKFDDHAPFGHVTDEKRLAEIGQQGVLAVFGDSTNAMKETEAGSEGPVQAHIADIIANTKGRIFFASFASHMGRVLPVAEMAAKSGRKVAFLGRTVNKMLGYAKELGYYPDSLKNMVIEAEEVSGLPADKVFVFASGTQGEGGSSLTRLSQGMDVRGIKLKSDDTVVLSSRMIPGNERAILNVINGLSTLDVNVISELTDRKIHVSGHGGRPEMARLYSLLKPTYVVPVHGEPMQMKAHAELARELGYQPLRLQPTRKLVLAEGVADEGEELPLEEAGRAKGKAFKPFHTQHTYPHGFNYIDGLNILENDPLILRERRKIAYEGLVSAALAINTRSGEWVSDIALTTRGLLDEVIQADIMKGAVAKVMQVLETIFPDGRIDDRTRAAEAIQQALRKHFKHERGKLPTTVVQFVEV
jgi:ribonuclease J